MENLLVHTEWSAPLGLSAPSWGVLTLIGYFFFWQLAQKR